MSTMPELNTGGAMTSRDDARIQQLGMISTRSKNGKMSDKEMREVANQFENMIFRALMKEMRKTVPENKLIEESHATKMYREITDDYLVDELSASNDLGIEGVIYQELVEMNKDIVAPQDLDDHAADFTPLAEKKFQANPSNQENGASADGFFALHPQREMQPIHALPAWLDIQEHASGFMNIENKRPIPGNKIDRGF